MTSETKCLKIILNDGLGGAEFAGNSAEKHADQLQFESSLISNNVKSQNLSSFLEGWFRTAQIF
jgi:hypothetical protein